MFGQYRRVLRAFFVATVCIILIGGFVSGALTAQRRSDSLLFSAQYKRALLVSGGDSVTLYTDGAGVSLDKSDARAVYAYIKYFLPGCVNAVRWLVEIIMYA